MFYKDALALEFSARGIPFEAEVRCIVEYKGRQLRGQYRMDFVCFGEVVVEVKAKSITGAVTKPKALPPLPRKRHPGVPKEIAFSVRLTAEEHELLRQAAVLRGWTPTNLIRSATIEMAKQILNTSRVTTFNFKGLAVRIADQIFKPRTYEVPMDESVTLMTEGQLFEETGVRRQIEPFSMLDLAEFKSAVKFGGGEFLNQILEYCEGLTGAGTGDRYWLDDLDRIGNASGPKSISQLVNLILDRACNHSTECDFTICAFCGPGVICGPCRSKPRSSSPSSSSSRRSSGSSCSWRRAGARRKRKS